MRTRAGLVVSSWRQAVGFDDYDDGLNGVGEIGRLLRAGGVIRFQGDTGIRYIDFEPSTALTLWDRPEDMVRALTQGVYPEGIPLEIVRQPFLRGAELDSAVNILDNPSLYREDATNAGRPADFDWDVTTGITNESIDSATEAYKFDIATSAVRDLEQTTPAGTAASGEVWTLSFFAYASAGTTGRAQAVIRFLDSGGSPLGTEQVGTLTALPTSQPNRSDPTATISVTTAAAPASTSRILATIRFDNSDAASNTVHLQLAQLEKASAPSLWVAGEEFMDHQPGNDSGPLMPVFIHGEGTTPLRLEYELDPAGSSVTKMVNAIGWSGGNRGGRSLLGWLNRIIEVEDYTNRNGATDVVDANASGGNAIETDRATTTAHVVVSEIVLTSNLDELRGTWTVWVRLRSNVGTHGVQLKWLLDDQGTTGGGAIAYENKKHEAYSSSTYGWLNLGLIDVPRDAPLAGLTLELWADLSESSGEMRFDAVRLVPAELEMGMVQNADTIGSFANLVNGEAFLLDGETFVIERLDSAGGIRAAEYEIRGPIPQGRPGLNVLFAVAGLLDGTIPDDHLEDFRGSLIGRVRYSPRYL